MNSPGDGPSFDLMGFLESASAEPLPADVTDEPDEAVIEARLRELGGTDDAWFARAREFQAL